MDSLIKNMAVSIVVLLLSGFNVDTEPSTNKGQIQIQWIDHLEGEFDFRTQWNYPEGVYRNRFGQLSCDGFCPEGVYNMMDNEGKIYADSLERFYQLVDTSHQFHTIQCKAWCYEWAGTHFIKAKRNDNKITCYTLNNSSTHCSLIIEILNETCIPRIELRSIAHPGIKTYYCKGGYMKIDKELWSRNIIKAEFDFKFDNTDEPDKHIFWKGRIYTSIE